MIDKNLWIGTHLEVCVFNQHVSIVGCKLSIGSFVDECDLVIGNWYTIMLGSRHMKPSTSSKIYFSFNCFVIKSDGRPLMFIQYNAPRYVLHMHSLNQVSVITTLLLFFFRLRKYTKIHEKLLFNRWAIHQTHNHVMVSPNP